MDADHSRHARSPGGAPGSRAFTVEMRILCKQCGASLVGNLFEVDEGFTFDISEGAEVVPPRRFAFSKPESGCREPSVVVSLADAGMLGKPEGDPDRGYGCCGYTDTAGLNLTCGCGFDVGYECSDCTVPPMAYFPLTRIELKRSEESGGNKLSPAAS